MNKSKREENIRLLQLAAAGKLKAEDLQNNGEPVFDICLDLKGSGACRSKYTEAEIQRLKAKGQWFDVTLNIS